MGSRYCPLSPGYTDARVGFVRSVSSLPFLDRRFLVSSFRATARFNTFASPYLRPCGRARNGGASPLPGPRPSAVGRGAPAPPPSTLLPTVAPADGAAGYGRAVFRGFAPTRFFVGWRVPLLQGAYGLSTLWRGCAPPASAASVTGAYTRRFYGRRRRAFPHCNAPASKRAFSFFLNFLEPFQPL